MILDSDIELLKSRLTPENILGHIGYEKSKPKRSGDEVRDACPVHKGDGSNLAISIENGSWCCHSHGCKGGDLIELYIQAKGIDFPTAVRELLSLCGIAHQSSTNTRSVSSVLKNKGESNPHDKIVASRKIAAQKWAQSSEKGSHPYFEEKGIAPPSGVRFGPDEKGNPSIVVPFRDVDGNLQTVQYVKKGKKFFATGTTPDAAFFTFGSLEGSGRVYVCEGIATAASIWLSENKAITTLSCGSWQNIPKVIAALKKKNTDLEVVVCLDIGDGGESAAQKTRELECTGITFRRPNFDGLKIAEVMDGKKKPAKDFNDLHTNLADGAERGLIEVKKQLQIDFCADAHTQNREILIKYYRDRPTGLKIGFKMGDEDELDIPPAALTIFTAPTKHGKTTVLVNVALGALEHNVGSSILFVTLEERKEPILVRFVNAYAETELSKNNKKTIEAFYKNYGQPSEADGVAFEKRKKEFLVFKEREGEFFERFMDTERLHLFDRADAKGLDDLSNLEKFVRHAQTSKQIGMVIVDYIQLLHLPGVKNMSRQEELKKICLRLKNLANETGLPIVMAAQFNREVVNEYDLHSSKIGEAGDIERHAGLVVAMWNRTKPQVKKSGQPEIPMQSQEILFKMLENRYGPSDMSFVFPFNGNTGVVSPHPQPSFAQPRMANNAKIKKSHGTSLKSGFDLASHKEVDE